MKLKNLLKLLKLFSVIQTIIFIISNKTYSSHLSKANQTQLDYVHSYRIYNVPKKMDKYEIEPISNHRNFEIEIKKKNNFNKIKNENSILSYIIYKNGKIIVDEYDNKLINNNTKLASHSIAKSMTSYVLAHAICAGYIKDINHKIKDYKILSNTLYYGQIIKNLINMRSGDQNYSTYKSSEFYNSLLLKKYKSFQTNLNIDYQNTTQSKEIKYNYNHMPPDIVLNYIKYRSKENFQKILKSTFNKKAKIKNSVFFIKDKDGDAVATSWFYATRYDYLRIAEAMMIDWKNNTCEGKYLKQIYKTRKKKAQNWKPNKIEHNASSYGGFFHFDISGLKKKKIAAMNGHGGQRILIDFENEIIVSIQAIRMDYNYKKLVLDPFK